MDLDPGCDCTVPPPTRDRDRLGGWPDPGVVGVPIRLVGPDGMSGVMPLVEDLRDRPGKLREKRFNIRICYLRRAILAIIMRAKSLLTIDEA